MSFDDSVGINGKQCRSLIAEIKERKKIINLHEVKKSGILTKDLTNEDIMVSFNLMDTSNYTKKKRKK